MTATAWTIHDRFKELKNNGTINLDADAFEVRLATSTSNIATTSVGDATTVTNEVAGNGYAAQTAVGTLSRIAGVVNLDTPDVTFTATGALTARFAYLVDTTTTPDEVVAHTLLDDTPADVVLSNGQSLVLTIVGIFDES